MLIKKIICLFKGHTSLTRDTETISHYIRIPAGRGAFCRDPERYEYDGRLYRCACCGTLILHYGICSWELEDLLTATLQDYIPIAWNYYSQQNYEFVNHLYGVGK